MSSTSTTCPATQRKAPLEMACGQYEQRPGQSPTSCRSRRTERRRTVRTNCRSKARTIRTNHRRRTSQRTDDGQFGQLFDPGPSYEENRQPRPRQTMRLPIACASRPRAHLAANAPAEPRNASGGRMADLKSGTDGQSREPERRTHRFACGQPLAHDHCASPNSQNLRVSGARLLRPDTPTCMSNECSIS
jgi:hypothetical protein